MRSRADLLPPDIAAAAAAIANARAGRRGAPAVANVLDLLPQSLFDEVVEDARAVCTALAAIPPKPRVSGALRGTDASILGRELRAANVTILARDRHGRATAVLWADGIATYELGHAHADPLWDAVTAALPDGEPSSPDHTEPTP